MIFLTSICFSTAFAQGEDNFVRDTVLTKILRKYLIEHIDVYTLDSAGKKAPLDSAFIQEEYGNVFISSTNLKTDSIFSDKKLVGIYAYRFADVSSRPHLYIQFLNRLEFIDLDSKDFNLDKLLHKVMKFFKQYSKEFTLQERVKTIQGVMETVYYNKFAEYSW